MLATGAFGCTSSVEDPAPPDAVEGTSTVESGSPCVAPSPLADSAVPESPVLLPTGAVLTDVTEAAGQQLITGRVDLPVAAVLEHFRAAPGFVVSRDEDEGRGGRLQLFGVSGDVGVTVARLTCPRGVTGFTVSSAGQAVTQPSPSG